MKECKIKKETAKKYIHTRICINPLKIDGTIIGLLLLILTEELTNNCKQLRQIPRKEQIGLSTCEPQKS